MTSAIDELDARLIALLRDEPRLGPDGGRRGASGVARGTVQARLAKLEERGVVHRLRPRARPGRLGYPVLAFVFLQIAQGRLRRRSRPRATPEVLEAHGDERPAATCSAASSRATPSTSRRSSTGCCPTPRSAARRATSRCRARSPTATRRSCRPRARRASGHAARSAVDDERVERRRSGGRRAARRRSSSRRCVRGSPRRVRSQLLAGDRPPELVDDGGRIAGDLRELALEVLGPQPQPRVARERRVAGDDVHLAVVEERVLVEVRRADVSQRSSTIPTFAWT